MKKFYIKSLGCKTNQIEGQIIAESLINLGFIETKNKLEAEIYILNSCTVTEHSDNQASYLIKQIKAQKPDIKVILTGCSAQTKDRETFGADLILGNREKLDIEKYINELSKDGKKAHVDDIFSQSEYNNKFIYKTSFEYI